MPYPTGRAGSDARVPRVTARAARAPVTVLLAGVAVLAVAWPLVTRPFWYDEQWRAFHVALGVRQWSALRGTGAPLAAGWLGLEQLVGAVFGLHEWALRLPSVLALLGVGPATYLLGRWWLPPGAAAVAGMLVAVNGGLLVYGLELKSYLVEACLTPLVVHTWLSAGTARSRGQAVWPAYLGLGGLCVVSLPAVFLLAPLLLLDALRLRRPRALVWPGVAAAVALVHLVVFVQRQTFLSGDPGWDTSYVRGPGDLARTVASYASGFPTLGLARPDDNPTSPFRGSALLHHPPLALSIIVGLLVGALLVIGLVRGRGAAREVTLALGGALLLVEVAAAAHAWPAGAVRVNLFVVPLLVLVAVTGAVSMPEVRAAVPVASVLAAALVGVGLHWSVVARETAHDPILLGGLRAQQALQRAAARPGDVAVVLTGRPQLDQWTKGERFYAQRYPWGSAGSAAPAREVYAAAGWVPGAVTAWLGGRAPHAVFVSTYNRVTDADAAGLAGELARAGWCPRETRTQRLTGTWTELVRCAG